MTDEPAKRKDEVVRLLSDVESQAERVEALGQDIARSARLARDVVGPICYVISKMPAEALSQEALDQLLQRIVGGFHQRLDGDDCDGLLDVTSVAPAPSRRGGRQVAVTADP